MVKSWLKRATNGRPIFWLLLAIAILWIAGPGLLRAAEAYAADPQGEAQAAKKLARKAAAQPGGSQATAAPEAARPTTPPKWGPIEPGRRDPFNIPKPEKGPDAEAGGSEGTPVPMGEMPKGKKGLVIGQLRLEGIVNQKASNSMIAVVMSPVSRAAFFLREKDELYNGVVDKITPDSIFFTENARDPSGQVVSHQVVKKLGAGPGEK